VRRISRADFEQRPWLLDEVDPLTHLLFMQRDVISFRQALQHMSRGALRHKVDSGRWQQVHRGILVAHDGPIGDEQRLWIATLAAGHGAVVGGRTALAMQGMKGFTSSLIHLLVPSGRRERDAPTGVAVHRTTRLAELDIRATLRPTCTTIERSVVDAASWARSDDEARTVIAMVFQQRLVTLDGITAVLKRQTRAKRRRLIVQCAQDAAGGSHSLGELKVLQLLRAAGLPEPSRQKIRIDASGRRRYLDLYFDEYGVHVEIDGGHHTDPQQAWLDMDRENDVYLAGDRLLRLPVWLVRDRPQVALDHIRRALMAAGWRP
jgi:very-short-patch-repair endonuclease